MSGKPDDDETGLAILRTWRGIYLLVLAVSLLWVGLLTALSRAFS